jgi:hypothetical protein
VYRLQVLPQEVKKQCGGKCCRIFFFAPLDGKAEKGYDV